MNCEMTKNSQDEKWSIKNVFFTDGHFKMDLGPG